MSHPVTQEKITNSQEKFEKSAKLTSMNACGLGHLCARENLRVHSAVRRPSFKAIALKKSRRVYLSCGLSSAVMPTSNNTTWGRERNICLFGAGLPGSIRTRMLPGCKSAWMKLSTWTHDSSQKNVLYDKVQTKNLHKVCEPVLKTDPLYSTYDHPKFTF